MRGLGLFLGLFGIGTGTGGSLPPGAHSLDFSKAANSGYITIISAFAA